MSNIPLETVVAVAQINVVGAGATFVSNRGCAGLVRTGAGKVEITLNKPIPIGSVATVTGSVVSIGVGPINPWITWMRLSDTVWQAFATSDGVTGDDNVTFVISIARLED